MGKNHSTEAVMLRMQVTWSGIVIEFLSTQCHLPEIIGSNTVINSGEQKWKWGGAA